jgi:hypothetical protein
LKLLGIVVVLCAACGAAAPALAQQSIDLASLNGRVLDPSGATVPAAQITARHTQTNLTHTVVADGEGRFRFPYLRIGPYEITIRQRGFEDAIRHLTVTAGAARPSR